MHDMVNLMGHSVEELKQFFTELDEKPFRALQVYKWIHQEGVSDFSLMTNLSKALRAKLSTLATIQAPTIMLEKPSADGTCKWLFKLDDGQVIETVFIPQHDRGTLCVSSQVGCALDCTFCATARQGFNRNLSAAEVIGQVWAARKALKERLDKDRVITNVVMMGMGEPLANYHNVVTAMRIMLDDDGYGLSRRRVTLSTSGVVPALNRLADDIDVALAISLHAPTDELRNKLVPINQKYPIAVLLEACRNFMATKTSSRDHITFEYVMLDGINDSPAQAKQLITLLQGIPAKVNLIPFNTFVGTQYKRSSDSAIDRFQDILSSSGLYTMTRRTRGDDIDAACGQLAGDIVDKSNRPLRFKKLEQALLND